MKTKHFLLFLALSLLTQVALAEGGGQRPGGDIGLNRRVKTKNNFIGVQGSINIQFTFRTVGGVIRTRSTPSFYLGGRGVNGAGQPIEVDAGIEYDNGFNTGYEGWELFIARTTGAGHPERTNPRFWNGSSWQVHRRHGNTHNLEYGVDGQGRLRLQVGSTEFYWRDNDLNNDGTVDVNPPSGTSNPPPTGVAFWPWAAIGQAAINSGAFNQHSVKRVTAITQTPSAANPEGVLDGTTVTGAFYSGEVTPFGGSSTPWTTTQTSQVRDGRGTGYDAPELGILAFDATVGGRTTADSEFRVHFPHVMPSTGIGPGLDTPGGMPRSDQPQSINGTEQNTTRYSRETVELNLKSYPVGSVTFTY